MANPKHLNVLDYYARFYRPGMADLSASSPPPAVEPEDVSVDYCPPGGLPALREGISRLYPGVRAEQVVVTNGASEALAAAAFALIRRGDAVLAAPSIYPSFRTVARRLGGAVIAQDPKGTASVIALNNPSVPDGKLVDLSSALSAAEARGARVIADEVHLDLRPLIGCAPAALLSRTAVSIGDLSKPLGLGGLRIGWAVCRDAAAIKTIEAAVQLLSGGPSALAMEFAVRAIAQYESRLAQRCSAAAEAGPRVFTALNEAGWKFTPPQAGWTFLATPPQPIGDCELARMRDAGCFLVPASAFGGEQGYRLSVFAPIQALRRVLGVPVVPPRPSSEGLVILTKAPQAGYSKTRLAAVFGAEVAAELAAAFLDDTLSVAQSSGREVTVAFAPASARMAMVKRAAWSRLLEQPDGDLGDRIHAALSATLKERRAAVLIGSDTPHLPPHVLVEAFGAVRSADLVVGPASDGGFYLLGSSLPTLPEQLFDGIEWSSPSVFARLMANAAAIGLNVKVLEVLTDIDDEASFRQVLASTVCVASAPLTRALVARLGLGSA